MTDVLLRNFDDGGNIQYINGQVTLSDGLETAAFLSLFGGNERDSGLEADDPLQWWGNLSETLPERLYRSQLQHLVASLPIIPANLRRIEDAAGVDLEWFVSTKLADFVQITASMPGLNTVRLDITIRIVDEEFRFSFTESSGLTT